MSKMKTRNIILAALFCALTAVAAQIVLPLGFTQIPLTFSMVAVYLTGSILDKKTAFFSMLAYVLLGAAGAPIFSNFSGGLGKLAGPTGGFILAYPIMAFLISAITEKWGRGFWKYTISMIIAITVCYAMGTIQLMIVAHMDISGALIAGTIPFIPMDLAKILLTSFVAVSLQHALSKAHLLTTAVI